VEKLIKTMGMLLKKYPTLFKVGTGV